jgi:hypothetical protein
MNVVAAPQAEVPVFGLGSSILDYGVSSLVPRHQRSRLDLFWPAIAFQVIVCTRSERSLNMFQEVVLRMARAGVTKREDIAEQTCLRPSLIRVVAVQLHSMGLLHASGLPTSDGEKLLDESRDYEETMTGYVFRDAWEGRLLPRFMRGPLPMFDVESPIRKGAGLFITGKLGTAGKPWRVNKAPVFEPPQVSPRASTLPTSWQVIKAIHGHRRDWRNNLSHVYQRGSGAGQPPVSASTVRITPRAEPVLLATVAFITDQNDETRRFEVCDPCGLGVSSFLQGVMSRSVSNGQSKHLADEIGHLVERAYGGPASDRRQELLKRRAQAAQAAENRCGGVAPAAIHESLINMELNYADTSKHPHEAAYVACVRVLEDVLAQQGDLGGGMGFADDGFDNVAMLVESASAVGFSDDTLQPILPRFFVVNGRRLRAVVSGEASSLDAVCGVLVCAARRNATHCFRNLAKEWSESLVFLAQLKEDRNRLSHKDRTLASPKLPRDEVLIGVYKIAQTLLAGRLKCDKRSPVEVSGSIAISATASDRDGRIVAAHVVETELGTEILADRALFNNLRDMLAHSTAVTQLLDGSSEFIPLEVMRPHIREAVKSAYAALECALTYLFSSSGAFRLTDVALDGKQIDDPQIDSAITAAGFDLPEAALRESLYFVSQAKLTKALERGECDSLGAAMVGLLLREQVAKGGILHELAKARPDFVAGVCRVIRHRGHEEVVIHPTEVCALSNTVMTLIKAVKRID